jgi:hypothetical protein
VSLLVRVWPGLAMRLVELGSRHGATSPSGVDEEDDAGGVGVGEANAVAMGEGRRHGAPQ